MTEGPTASGDGAGLKQVLAFRSPPLTLTEAHGGMAGWSVWQPRPTAQGSVAPGTPILLGCRVGASCLLYSVLSGEAGPHLEQV